MNFNASFRFRHLVAQVTLVTASILWRESNWGIKLENQIGEFKISGVT